jgi:hypothetical protein
MSITDETSVRNETVEPFLDPVAYLGLYGIEAEVVATLPAVPAAA